jgi:hypothetical protein
MIDFVFEEKIKQDIDNNLLVIHNDNPIKFVKGLALSDNTILINLSAVQWKLNMDTDLIEDITRTITHENMHILLRPMNNDLQSEEKICRIMAGQPV